MSSNCGSTTITEPQPWGQQSGEEKVDKMLLHPEDIRPELREDLHDPSYQDEEGPPPKLQYIWRKVIFMVLVHLGALYGITLIPSCKVYTCLFGMFYNIVAGLGITAGAHRLWSHRTYKARLPLRLFLILANTMAFQNDVYDWVQDHRVHHKFTETHADPHNSRRGFFFSHVGWLLVRKHPAVKEKGGKLDISDIKAEKLVMFQRRYYRPAVLLICVILPTLVPCVAHLYGYRPYNRNIGAREIGLISLVSLGEGFHKYHHAFPYDYSASEYGWHASLTTFFIDCMAALGLAYDRKKVSKATILARIKRTGDGSHKSG
ncbi:Acyl-CoA desaturase 4 [Microtus ochrogaster]|uniref:Acyl-CoA desaturase 4 n=1 Tax=Microtus ochrogaster TaxID=79684 RepID=A0A8J6G514_MICOH|nr:Acyl-CoA desaturase 4 [Microtus ochrogaster]